ncbi:FAD-binding domain-containing protein [Trichoderma citrinoviride]|uniref:FAD-binding domain-containing protein n=1 Tax=Trichoderma citrinoviride TaxID=58853 RepID=A0A2T4BAG7_9HYPO|nr:FAD-binding domain-containing protein [Trichoderma citrinoviride]PTB66231.1 FAD-binding domain-containing protein [Trichoderma citrinoviride]
MASITAGPEYYTPPPPGASSTAAIEQDAPALLDLHRQLPNLHIYTASSPDFDILNRVNDRSITTLPLATVRPTDEAQVAAAVRYIAQNGLTLAIRNSGADQGGRSRAYGPKDVSLDVRSMTKMVLSADRSSLTVDGGVAGGNVAKFLDSFGLATPTAFSPAVGYVGWACGGGYSSLNGIMGLGVDNILSGRVVLADGRVMDTDDADCDPDLLWALRGGGAGIVGVVSSLRIRCHRRPDVLAGVVLFPLEETPQIAKQLNELYAWKKPPKFAGDAAVFKRAGMDAACFSFLFHWSLEEDRSDLDEAKDYVERIAKMGTVLVNTVRETTPYGFISTMTEIRLYEELVFIKKQISVPGWSEELGRIISEPLPTASSNIIMHDSHGAGTRASGAALEENAAFQNREPHLMFGFFPSAHPDDKEGMKVGRAWADRLFDGIKKAGLAMPSHYINFASPEKGDGLLYYGPEAIVRIRAVKRRLDPSNLFAKSTPDIAEI